MKTLKYIIPLIAVFLLQTACENDFLDVNDNPNNPEDVNPEYILPAGELKLAYTLGGEINRICSFWTQHWATTYSQYREEDRYIMGPSDFDNIYTEIFPGALMDFEDAMLQARKKNKPNFEAVAQILKAYTFSIATDLWGDIPYSQALQPDEYMLPEYESQSSIYPKLIAELDAAMALIDPEASTYGSQDLIYGGDMELWKKFAQTLKLRLLMRMSYASDVSGEITALINEGGFISDNSENCIFEFGTKQSNYHPMYERVTTSGRDQDYAPSKTIVDVMNNLEDPRRSTYFKADPAVNEYIGTENGFAGKPDNYSTFPDNWIERDNPIAQSRPVLLMTAAESYFLQAEAAQRGWGGDAKALYEQAITTSMEQWGVGIGDYLSREDVAFQTAQGGDNAAAIALQKWIALYDQGMEAYSEWRRNHTPELSAALSNQNSDQIPVRWLYPQDEYDTNRSNIPEETTLNSPVWWDVESK